MASNAGYAPLNYTVVQGDHLLITVRVKENGSPVDASSWDWFYTLKASYADADADAIIQLNPDDATFSNYEGTNDQVDFVVPNTTIAGLTPGTEYYQDIQVIRSGVVRTYAKGVLEVEAEVTKRTAP